MKQRVKKNVQSSVENMLKLFGVDIAINKLEADLSNVSPSRQLCALTKQLLDKQGCIRTGSGLCTVLLWDHMARWSPGKGWNVLRSSQASLPISSRTD